MAPLRPGSIALAILFCLGPLVGVSAQGLDPLGRSGGRQTLVDPGPALEAARESFESAASETRDRVVGSRSLADPIRERVDGILEDAAKQFSRAAEQTVSDLRGDGILTADELSTALGDVRSEHLARLTSRLEAAVLGIEAPPAPTEGAPPERHVGRLIQYTLIERNPPTRWVLLLGFVAAGLFLAWIVSRTLDWLVQQFRRGRRQRVLAELVSTLDGPLYLATAVGGIAAGLRWIWVPVAVEEFVWLVLRVVFVAAAYWFAWNLCGALTSTVARAARRAKDSVNDQVIDMTRKGLRLFVTVVFVLFVTEVVFQSDIKGLLAGIGIAGLALSLAAQDTLKNILASFTIFGDRPFVLGDLVQVGDHFGKVEAVGFRSTRIRRFDGHLVTIPNSELVTRRIENVSARPHIRRRFYLDLPYATPLEKVRESRTILHDILDDMDCWPDDFQPKAEFVEFGPYSLRLLVEYRQQPPDYWGAFARDTDINLQILERFRDAGIHFAFPARHVLLEREDSSAGASESGS